MTKWRVLFAGLLAALMLPAPPSQAARKAQPARVVCGQTGCFDVPPGCRGEIRRSGKGVVAVVICPR